MKKLVAGTLLFAMIISLAACGKKSSGGKEPDAGGNQVTKPPVKNQVTIGNVTQLSGDFEEIWTNNGADSDVLRLISGYELVSYTKDGEYIYNKTAVKNVTETQNADGTKTFRFQLQDGLLFSDGTKVTAKDYLWFYALFANKKLAASFELSGNAGKDFEGHDAYADGDLSLFATEEKKGAVPFSGLRYLSDTELSVTVAAENLPYYFDKLMVALKPYPMHVWLPSDVTVKDDGNGIYLSGNISENNLKKTVEQARWDSTDRVSCGPYVLKGYDKSAATASLALNTLFLGNYEGQKASIEKIYYIKLENETQLDMLKTGEVDIISGMIDGSEINAALDLVAKGGFESTNYQRNGYGKLSFVCDFGPTQFVGVRQAIAHLLNREEFAGQFCQGYGTVVNGPYGLSMAEYEATEDELFERLNSYSYNPDKAIALLIEEGFVYGADGKPYQSGIRYKEITKEQGIGYEDRNVTLSDGRILMPLIIEWLSAEKNPVSELLDVMLVQGEATQRAGMKINRTTVQFSELMNWLLRDASQGAQYEIPTYNMFNLATEFTGAYDQSYQWTTDETLMAYGYNIQRLRDEQLDRLSMDMVYGVEAGDSEGYLSYFVQYIDRFNELLPELPLYSNMIYDVTRDNIKGYEANSLWKATNAIIYCTIE